MTDTSVGRESDLNPYSYFFVFSRIRNNAQNECVRGEGSIICILFSFV